MTTHADIGRHHADTGAEVLALLRAGGGHRRCYDAFAPELYRYCWTLLGPDQGEEPDRAGAAVRHALLAAAYFAPDMGDRPAELRPWLFALARAAARLRGFSPRSPYAGLATADSEKPAVELALRLPPSHRELLELRLRHGLAPEHIARLLGLAEETAHELCASAVARAAETLSALPAPAPGPDGTPDPATGEDGTPGPAAGQSGAPDPATGTGTHTGAAPSGNTAHAGAAGEQARQETTGGYTDAERAVRAYLAELDPPGPPATLRSLVLRECASPLGGPERRAAATALAPLDADGYPLHRDRPAPATGRLPIGGVPPAPVAADGGAGATGTTGAGDAPRVRVGRVSRTATGTAASGGTGHGDHTRSDDDTDEDMTALDSGARERTGRGTDSTTPPGSADGGPGSAPAESTRALPADRITTRDVASGPPEQIAELGLPGAGADDDLRHRRLGPASAGLIGAAILAATWGAMALLGQGGGDTVDSGLPGSVLPFPIAGDDADAAISDPAHAPHPSPDPAGPRVLGEAAAEAETVPPVEDGEEPGPEAPQEDTDPADPAPEPTAAPAPVPEPPSEPSPPDEAPPDEDEEPEEKPRGPVGRFFDDLTGLFTPRG
ncbi:hypothetical protein ACFO4E_13740 [Nocardiopsis mangrovi]|uniref:DNA-directed RNA polymerase specialized sigma24 family protein n=1 Tax=Nocardiopsis mangrovi TaxID=1179818 RepID=A0ABV9DW26_9ACTN